MIPIVGHYTIDAATAKAAVDALNPTVVVPMHCRPEKFGFDVIETLAPFRALAENSVFDEGAIILI